MNEYILVTVISALVFGKVTWGWWLRYVFDRMGLKIHPTHKVPIVLESIDIVVITMLARMERACTITQVVFAYLVGTEAESFQGAVASGFGATVMMLSPYALCFLQASKPEHKDLFVMLVKLFVRPAERK